VAARGNDVVKRNRPRPHTVYYRRSPFLVSYWKGKYLLFENYLTGKVVTASAEALALLDFFDRWRTVESTYRQWPQYSAKSLRDSVRQLTQATLLESTIQKNFQGTPRVRALQQWREWIPSAAYFHMSTKDVYDAEISKEEIQHIERLMERRAASLALEQKPNGKLISLRSSLRASEFPQVLTQRRTWREFSAQKVKEDTFATLLDLSFGVQRWDRVAKLGKVAQKTSPSGGSLHPLEAYLMVRKVEGISPGIYRYDAIGKGLKRIHRGVTPNAIQKYLAGQWWFRDAAFVVFLTAVFARTQWKYDYARAYRAILIEAGHLCQTFCLTATWLGLAPFCTIAMADTKIENALKIDGISESVVYAMGAGVKPGVGL
jgi:SagB-type dehydrogenase family enzyme